MVRELCGLVWEIVLTVAWFISSTYWGYNLLMGAIWIVLIFSDADPRVLGLMGVLTVMGNIGVYLMRRDQREDEEEK